MSYLTVTTCRVIKSYEVHGANSGTDHCMYHIKVNTLFPYVGPCRYGMAHPWVVNGGDKLPGTESSCEYIE
jgi:hypothetical protein